MRYIISAAILAVGILLLGGPVGADEIVDHWGLREATPAVVHPAVVSPLQEVVSLRGEWDFVTDPRLMGRHRMGKGPAWNEPDWSGAPRSYAGCERERGRGLRSGAERVSAVDAGEPVAVCCRRAPPATKRT